jgi:hypothetical protein
MSINITVNGTAYTVPSSAVDTNWAAQQVAFLQALASMANTSPRVIYSSVTPVGTGADTTEDTLMTYTMPANTLSANKMGIRVTAWGSGLSTADTTTVRCYFGSNVIVSKVLTASQANTWRAVFEVARTGATAQTGSGVIDNGGTASSLACGRGTATETLSGAVTIKLTGERLVSSVSNSIVQNFMLVELLPVAA